MSTENATNRARYEELVGVIAQVLALAAPLTAARDIAGVRAGAAKIRALLSEALDLARTLKHHSSFTGGISVALERAENLTTATTADWLGFVRLEANRTISDLATVQALVEFFSTSEQREAEVLAEVQAAQATWPARPALAHGLRGIAGGRANDPSESDFTN